MKKENSLKEVAGLFLKLGIVGFGGPAAHISMMQEEVVRRRKWFTEQHFLDLVGATHLIPGPNSTEMAIHIGREKAGWKGVIVAGLCFILPAVCITGVLAWLYKEFGLLPQVKAFIYGIQPALIAIISGAVFPLAKKSLISIELALIGAVALVLSLANVNEAYVLFGAGFLGLFLSTIKNIGSIHSSILPLISLNLFSNIIFTSINGKLFLIFLKIGAICMEVDTFYSHFWTRNSWQQE